MDEVNNKTITTTSSTIDRQQQNHQESGGVEGSSNSTSIPPSLSFPNVVRVGIGVLLYNEQKEIYVGIRKNSHGQGTLAFPGGHLEYGESFTDCAIREVQEEMNISCITSNQLQCVHISNNIMTDEQKHYVTIIMMYMEPLSNSMIPINMEPEKCFGWVPYKLEQLLQIVQNEPNQLFQPLRQLLIDLPPIIEKTILNNTTTTNNNNNKTTTTTVTTTTASTATE